MPFITINNMKLFYTDSENKDPTILLHHGWSCYSHDWSWELLVLVAKGFRVIAIDRRGQGRSSAPKDFSYKPQQPAEDAASLLDSLHITSAIVMGHSMGTIVASALCVQRPDLVRSLIHIDPVYNVPVEVVAPFVEAMKSPSVYETAGALYDTFYTEGTLRF
jgi:pimeloyl-ACP methyl ester carboxylesterase